MGELTLEKDLISATNVGNSSATLPVSFNTMEFTLGHSLLGAVNLGKPSAKGPPLLSIRKFTTEKGM